MGLLETLETLLEYNQTNTTTRKTKTTTTPRTSTNSKANPNFQNVGLTEKTTTKWKLANSSYSSGGSKRIVANRNREGGIGPCGFPMRGFK